MVAITDVVGSMLQEKKDAGRNRAWMEDLANCPQPEKGYQQFIWWAGS